MIEFFLLGVIFGWFLTGILGAWLEDGP